MSRPWLDFVVSVDKVRMVSRSSGNGVRESGVA
jgi:hypothetical protein